MERKIVSGLYVSLFLFALANVVEASDGSFTDQFLGNPLLILSALIIIDVIAFLYHKIRK